MYLGSGLLSVGWELVKTFSHILLNICSTLNIHSFQLAHIIIDNHILLHYIPVSLSYLNSYSKLLTIQ